MFLIRDYIISTINANIWVKSTIRINIQKKVQNKSFQNQGLPAIKQGYSVKLSLWLFCSFTQIIFLTDFQKEKKHVDLRIYVQQRSGATGKMQKFHMKKFKKQ